MRGRIWQSCFTTHHDVLSASRWEAEVISVCQDPAETMAVWLCELLASTGIGPLAEGLICHPVTVPSSGAGLIHLLLSIPSDSSPTDRISLHMDLRPKSLKHLRLGRKSL